MEVQEGAWWTVVEVVLGRGGVMGCHSVFVPACGLGFGFLGFGRAWVHVMCGEVHVATFTRLDSLDTCDLTP